MRGSCKTKNEDIAARQIAEIEAGYWKGHFDGPAAVLTFAHACRLYRAAGKADRFLEAVEMHLKHTLVKDITEGTIQVMAKELYPDWSGASLNRAVIVPTQAVINHAAKLRMCSPIKVARYKEETKVKEPVTLEWIEEFRREASAHLGAMVLFMYLTGARPSEALAVRWDDLDLTAQTVRIRESKVSKERISHLPMPLVVALANLPRIEGRGVFVYQRVPHAYNAWDGVIGRAGIKPLTPHSCRHGFATGLLRRGVDVVTVAWLGGWASPAQVLKTYGHATKNPKLTELLTGAEINHLAEESTERKTG
jgi:integrase